MSFNRSNNKDTGTYQSSTVDLDKILAEILSEYKQIYNNNISSLRKAIPREETWRFLVDGDHQNLGWEQYEIREPGYLLAMEATFSLLFNKHNSIDSSEGLNTFIQTLHLSSTTNVNNLLYNADACGVNEQKGLYRQCQYSYVPLRQESISEAGIEELLIEIKNYPESTVFPVIHYLVKAIDASEASNKEKISIEKHQYFYLIPDFVTKFYACPVNFQESYTIKLNDFLAAGDKITITYGLTYISYFVNDVKGNGLHVRQALNSKMHDRIEIFYNTIQQPKTEKDKLKCIILFIRDCERIHPFFDRNTCVFSMLLLNYLLITYGFPLVIRDNPNSSYAHTAEELMQDVLIGMQRTLNLAKGIIPYKNTTKKHYEILSEERKLYFQKSINIYDEQDNFLFPISNMNLDNYIKVKINQILPLQPLQPLKQPLKMMFDAVKKNNPKELRELANYYYMENPNVLDNEEKLAMIHIATREGYTEIVTILAIEQQANINIKGIDKITPLHFAAQKNRSDIIQVLRKLKYLEVNPITEQDKMTPLHLAAQDGYSKVVMQLITLGANINEQTINGYTALYLALKNKHVAVVLTLLDAGADVNIQPKENESWQNEVISILKDADADANKLIQNENDKIKTKCDNWIKFFDAKAKDNSLIANNNDKIKAINPTPEKFLEEKKQAEKIKNERRCGCAIS